MPGRKRDNPQRLDVESAAKRQELFQFVPRLRERSTTADRHVACADSACITQSDHAPLTVINNSSSDNSDSTPSVDTQKSLDECRTGQTLGITREPFSISVPHHSLHLLHSKMQTNDVARILGAKADPASEHNQGPVLFGKIVVQPKFTCPDFDQLLGEERKPVIRVSLVSIFDPFTHKVTSDYLKIDDGENISHLEVSMDYRLETPEARKAFNALFKSSAKAFLMYQFRGNEENPVVMLELWAFEKLCEFDSPSDCTKRTSLTSHANTLVEALYPEMLVQQQESLLSEASSSCARSSKHLSVVEQIDKFYKDIQLKRTSGSSAVTGTWEAASCAPGLTAELRGYQRQGVEWMLEREGRLEEEEEAKMEEMDEPRPLHVLWKELPTMEHGLPCAVYFNTHSGKFTTRRFPKPHWPKGGILADEMGLGKTVEVLALVMSHKWSGPHPRPHPHNQQTSEEMSETNGESFESTNEIEIMDVDAHVQSVDSTSEVGVAKSNTVGVVDSKVRVGVEGTASQVLDEVRCVCGATKEDKFEREFVQCERCLLWQHSTCVRFDSVKESSFVCVRCLLKKPMSCGTTLIVSPQSIAQQWMEEIEKHTEPGSLKVMLYEGVKRSTGYVSPATLATYDVVLVTYETLKSEFYHATSHEVTWNFRRKKRYHCYPSPLPAVYWWRVCLDEAQMVESTHAKAAEMMMKVTSVNRWCVTGTPVQRSLLDLHGLVLFLGVEPYSLLPWFQRLVWKPFLEGRESAMISLFSKIIWRSSKVDVAEELRLPKQTEELHWLSFSSVEKYFYLRQQETCARDLMRVVSGLQQDSATLSSLLHSTVNKLMHSLHSLRQACCHPAIVRNSYLPVNVGGRNYMTMPALLKKLTQHSKGQTRDSLRMQVSAFNGLAGLHILKEEFQTAVDMYRSAMTVWQDHLSHEVECDRVQRIHTLENLADLLAQGHGGDTRTLRDDSLITEAKQLRSEFMKRSRGQVLAAEEAFIVCKRNVKDAEYEADKSQAKFLDELPKELKEMEKQENCSTPEREGEGELSNEGSEKNAEQQGNDTACESGQTGDLQDKEGESGQTGDLQDKAGESGQTGNLQDKAGESGQTGDLQDKAGTSHSDAAVNDSTASPAAVKVAIQEIKRPTITPSQCWWLSVSDWAAGHKLSFNLLEHVNSEISADTNPYRTLRIKFKDVDGIIFKLFMDIDKLKLSRDLVLSGLQSLLEPPSPEFIVQVGACHIRRGMPQGMDLLVLDDSPEEKCQLCQVEEKTIAYERQLFSRYEPTVDEVMRSNHSDGFRGLSDFEHILKAMLTFVRYKGAPCHLLKSGQALLGYLDNLKKEYKAVRKLWMALHEHFSDCDELRQAAHRIRFMTAAERTMYMYLDDIPFAVRPSLVDMRIMQCQADLQEAKTNLRKHLGQLVYLQNLAKTPEQKEANTEPCLICTGRLGKEWGVFTCGHPFCIDCILTLVRRHPDSRHRRVSIKCPLCREPTISTEINYIKPASENSLDRKESHSTKVIAVIETLINIQQNDPGAKALVFSAWKEVLDMIGQALHDNSIDYRLLSSDKKKFQSNLSEFKRSENVNVLLLLFHSGSKGLNIVEATHVLLVEPQLNVSAEQQAIGRVHRIGQKRPTFVHRFYIENTVEEKMYHLLSSRLEGVELLVNNECDGILTVADIRSLVEQ